MKKGKIEEFIIKANNIHNSAYDYSESRYINARTKIKIICKTHGVFEQTPDNHLRGNTCPICSNRKRISTDQFINKAKEIHGNEYDYSKVKYVNNLTKVEIICPKHGTFLQSPVKHINEKRKCIFCSRESAAKKRTNSKDYFIDKSRIMHGDKYDYSEVDYINNSTKVKIVCPNHGEFEQSPDKHMSGQDCPFCKTSKGEKRILMFLKNNKIEFKYQYRFDKCRNDQPLPFDFFIESINTCIEYDGKQHYNKDTRYYTDRLVENDSIKNQFCIKNNIELIRIPYWDFNRIESILYAKLKIEKKE